MLHKATIPVSILETSVRVPDVSKVESRVLCYTFQHRPRLQDERRESDPTQISTWSELRDDR